MYQYEYIHYEYVHYLVGQAYSRYVPVPVNDVTEFFLPSESACLLRNWSFHKLIATNVDAWRRAQTIVVGPSDLGNGR